MRRYRLKVPMNLMLLLKVFMMVLDIGVRLDPKFNFGKEVTPYLTKLADTNTLSAGYVKRASTSLLDGVDALLDMPRNLNLMLRRLSTGTFKLEIVDTDIQKLQMALDKASDKLMIGMVVAALVVGSSLVLRKARSSSRGGSPILPLQGYTAAVLTGFYAIYHVVFLKFPDGAVGLVSPILFFVPSSYTYALPFPAEDSRSNNRHHCSDRALWFSNTHTEDPCLGDDATRASRPARHRILCGSGLLVDHVPEQAR